MMYKVGDTGLFIGELTSPFIGGNTFYEKSIVPLFNNYKKKMADSGVKFNKRDNALFYTPSAYCMMGNYDLAIISLIEDFHFSNRHFHPYSFLNENATGFNYHLTTGSACHTESDYLISKAKKTFLKETNRYPFIGISSFKIKNSVLIGTGYEIVQLATMALNKLLAEFKSNNPKFDFIVFESISWNEIGVIFFSNDYKSIADAILLCREVSISYGLSNYSPAERRRLKKEILTNSLIGKSLTGEDKEHTILNSHLFTHTYSNLGLDINWLAKYKHTDAPEVAYEGFLTAIMSRQFSGFTRWFVKPYHLQKFLDSDEFKTNSPKGKPTDFYLIIGNGDVEETHNGFGSIYNILSKLKKFHIKSTASSQRSLAAVRKTKTIPKFSYQVNEVENLLKRYRVPKQKEPLPYSVSAKELKKYAFNSSEIIALRNHLVRLKLSKTLRERILNAFVMYNDGIQDPILYTGFIELRDYLKLVYRLIVKEASSLVDGSVDDIALDAETRIKKYNRWIEDFYSAYETLILHSHRLYGVTDFNLDYNGGIQPIVSGYDAIFKFLRNYFDYDKVSASIGLKPYFCVVSGMPGITSTGNNIRINYNHLFSPEFFLAAINKEVINHYFMFKTLHKFRSFPPALKTKFKTLSYYYRADNFAAAYKILEDPIVKEIEPAEIVIFLIETSHEHLLGECKRNLLNDITAIGDRKIKALVLEYLETINAATFYYLLEDYFSAQIIGRQRYLTWMWAMYSQESDVYNLDLTLNEPKLYRMLLRTAMLTRDENFDFDAKSFFERYSQVHGNQALYHWNSIQTFSSLLLETNLIPGFKTEDIFEYITEVVRQVLEKESTKDPNERLNELLLLPRFREALNKGNIVDIEVNNYKTLIALINAYLDEVHAIFPAKNIVLSRNSIDGTQSFENGVYIHKNITSGLLLDPTGGVYSLGVSTRRKYFRIRSTMTKALFDFSLKQKLSLFNK